MLCQAAKELLFGTSAYKLLKPFWFCMQSLVLGQKQPKSIVKHHADSDDSDEDSDSE